MPYQSDRVKDLEEIMDRYDNHDLSNSLDMLDDLDQLDQVFPDDPTGRDRGCLHDQLERSRPPSMKGEPHMLVCNCPKCRTIC